MALRKQVEWDPAVDEDFACWVTLRSLDGWVVEGMGTSTARGTVVYTFVHPTVSASGAGQAPVADRSPPC